jgi:uncharacterized protein (TIGR04141 family)
VKDSAIQAPANHFALATPIVPRLPRLQKITLFLLKEEVTLEGALRDRDALSSYEVPAISATGDALFVAGRPPHAPGWTRFLAPHVTGNLDALFTASASAVLLFESASRVFAVTFGQGRHLLDSEAYEQDFGLKVVLNTVAPDQLKSVDAKTIEETTLHTRRDVSRDSSFNAFGLDISRDLLRAVTGTPQDESLAHRVTGSAALGLWTRAQLPELPALAERLLAEYESDDYKRNFDFVDFLRPEKRASRIRELEATLVDALNARDIDDAHMAAPEILDPLDLGGFRFSSEPGEDVAADPRISAYLDSHSGDDIDLETLKSDRLIAVRSDGEIYQRWSVYRSIVFEVTHAGDLYVLTGGEWFRVNLDFKQRVYDEVDALDQRQDLPTADAGTDEGAYNVKAAEALDALCLDRKLVFDGGPDRMEICDVLTRDGGFIHVKQRGASSTLSHLFAQGVNSAERLLQDAEFRTQAREVVEREDASFVEVVPATRPADPSAFEVTFAVITRSTRPTPLTLPFFSVVSLRAAAARLRAFGFRVSVAEVHEQQ